MNAFRRVLVCGATGRQGGAVSRALLSHGFEVLALTKHVYARVTGRRAKWYRMPRWVVRWINKEFTEQLAWHNRVAFDGLRSTHGKILAYVWNQGDGFPSEKQTALRDAEFEIRGTPAIVQIKMLY